MKISLSDELKEFVQKKIENGQYPSEAAVIEAALQRFRDQENGSTKTVPTIDDFTDHEFVAYCGREADEKVTLDDVLEATSTTQQASIPVRNLFPSPSLLDRLQNRRCPVTNRQARLPPPSRS